jgi:hypothetical protein
MKIWRTLGMVTVCAFLADSTTVYADDTAQPAAAPASADVQVASVAPLAASTQQKAVDPLHADPRWPKLKNCIDNTNTQDEYQACLQMAFMDVAPTGKVLALLTR